MAFDQKKYLREMQAYNDDAYFSCYAKNHVGKLPPTPGDNLIQKAKEIKKTFAFFLAFYIYSV